MRPEYGIGAFSDIRDKPEYRTEEDYGDIQTLVNERILIIPTKTSPYMPGVFNIKVTWHWDEWIWRVEASNLREVFDYYDSVVCKPDLIKDGRSTWNWAQSMQLHGNCWCCHEVKEDFTHMYKPRGWEKSYKDELRCIGDESKRSNRYPDKYFKRGTWYLLHNTDCSSNNLSIPEHDGRIVDGMIHAWLMFNRRTLSGMKLRPFHLLWD